MDIGSITGKYVLCQGLGHCSQLPSFICIPLSVCSSLSASVSLQPLSDTHNTESTSISESGVNNSDNGNRKTQKNYKEKKNRKMFSGNTFLDTLGIRNPFFFFFRLRTWLYSSFTVLGTCSPYQICQTPQRLGTWQCYVHPSYGVSKKSFKKLILCLIKPMFFF